MTSGAASWTQEPVVAPIPLVLDSPHSGTAAAPFVHPIAPVESLRSTCDAFVDELYGSAPTHGATLIAATFPRWMIDANRARDDIDLDLIDGAWPHPANPTAKSRSGMGLLRRLALPDVPMYGRKFSVAEVEALIRDYYDPYHAAVKRALDAMHARFGAVWHIDCHSMKSRGNAMNDDAGRARPDFVVSDREGTTAEAAFTEYVAQALRAVGYRVNINDPYKGAELIRAWSDPPARRHSIQIEINRSLYMDEETVVRHQGFGRLARDLGGLLEQVAAFIRAQIPPPARDSR
jgi:N-formylglutamate deformylase